jgi:xylulokinase
VVEYIGIDIGTTNIKTAIYNYTGEQIAQARCPTPMVKAEIDAFYEYNVQDVYESILCCLCELNRKSRSKNVRALAVSSMGESGILLDCDKKPLVNAIAWFDQRSIPQAKRLAALLGEKEIFYITGQILSSKFGITKLMWHMETQPQIFEKARYWMSINDYILYRLSGNRVCDYSIASRTMAFDIKNLKWSEELCAAAGIDMEIFSDILPGGTKVGTITKEVSDKTGLPHETLVVTGGHDHPCALVGAGTLREGSMLSSMGTAEVTIFTLKQPQLTDSIFAHQYCITPHCSKRLYRISSSMQACGASIEWFLKSFGESLSRHIESFKINKYAYLDNIAASCQDDGRLLYFPLIRGSLSNNDAGGLFAGIRDHHKLEHFVRALLDGLCCEFTYQTEGCLDILETKIQTVHVVGGPSRSDYLMQRKANISGMTIEVPAHQEAACYGAALLAAVGAGDLTFDDLEQKFDKTSKQFIPIDEKKNRTIYYRYRRIRDLVDELNLYSAKPESP